MTVWLLHCNIDAFYFSSLISVASTAYYVIRQGVSYKWYPCLVPHLRIKALRFFPISKLTVCCKEVLTFPIHLLVYLMYFYQLGLMEYYFFQLVIISYYHYLFWCSNCIQFGQWEMPQLGYCVLPLVSIIFVLYLMFWYNETFQTCTFPALLLEWASSPRRSDSF